MISAVEVSGTVYEMDRYSGRIPVLKRNGDLDLMPWGVFSHYEPEDLPRGPDVALGKVRDGSLQHRRPRPVKIPAQRYRLSERGKDDQWFPVPVGKCLQGVMLDHDDMRGRSVIVYLVSVTAHPMANIGFYRVPRLISRRLSPTD